MALTNALLKSFGIEQDQRDQIMEAHQAVLDSIKAERDELRDTAAKVPELESKIQELESKQPTEDWEKKHSELMAEFDAYKKKVESDKEDAEKMRLYESIIKEAGITNEKLVGSILGGVDLSKLKISDGKIEDHDEIKASIAEEWKDFIPVEGKKGAEVDNPPSGSGGPAGANPDVLKRLAERHDRLYGKAAEGKE